MYLKDGIIYGQEKDAPIKIESVKILPDRIMLVSFVSGETRLFDATCLKGLAFEPLQDPHVFENPVIDHGVITWADGTIDIAPEAVYRDSYEYNEYPEEIITAVW